MRMDNNTIIQTGSDCNLFRNFVKGRKTVIITDENIFNLYPDLFSGFDHIVIGQGEEVKSLKTVEFIISEFVKKGIDRNSLIIGIGGGLVTDITGFVSSIYMRGVSFGFVPTSLLGQVDAAIGGKNGVNFSIHKNYIGNFNQPEFIICDSSFFETLPAVEYQSGLGEIFKYSLITKGGKLFSYITNNTNKLVNKDSKTLSYIINECIDIKTAIVEQDPFDQGIRNVLNLGHSFGHCVEISNNIPHGIAVASGILIASELSVKLSLLEQSKQLQILELFNNLGFKRSFSFNEEHLDMLFLDKKRDNNQIKLVLLKDIGLAQTIKLDRKELSEIL